MVHRYRGCGSLALHSWGPSGGVRGARSAIGNMVGARSANQKFGWSAERRFMILSRSVERCFEANMGGARSAKSKFPGALSIIFIFPDIFCLVIVIE